MSEHTASLGAFIRYLKKGDPSPLPDREVWSDMIRLTTAPGAPTMPSVSPRLRLNVMPSTALTVPSSVWK